MKEISIELTEIQYESIVSYSELYGLEPSVFVDKVFRLGFSSFRSSLDLFCVEVNADNFIKLVL